MHVREVSRSLFRFALVGAFLVTAISCGSSGSGDTFGDASTPDGPGSISISLEGGSTNKCVPKTCAQQGYT